MLAQPIYEGSTVGPLRKKPEEYIYSDGTVTPVSEHPQASGSNGCCKLTLNLSRLDIIRDILWRAAINLASDGESSSEDLLDGTLQLLCKGLEAHGAGNLNNLIEGDGLGVLDVLLLLAVTRWLLKGLDDEGRGGWNNGDGGLTVLDGKTDGNAESLPVTSSLGDIFSDLLWGETERTNLWSKCGRSTNLTSGGAEVDDLDLVWVDLWCW